MFIPDIIEELFGFAPFVGSLYLELLAMKNATTSSPIITKANGKVAPITTPILLPSSAIAVPLHSPSSSWKPSLQDTHVVLVAEVPTHFLHPSGHLEHPLDVEYK